MASNGLFDVPFIEDDTGVMAGEASPEDSNQLSDRVKHSVRSSYYRVERKVIAVLHRRKCKYCESPTRGYAHAKQKGKGRAAPTSDDEIDEMPDDISPCADRYSRMAYATGSNLWPGQDSSLDATRQRRNGYSWRRGAGEGASSGWWTIRSVRRSQSHSYLSSPGTSHAGVGPSANGVGGSTRNRTMGGRTGASSSPRLTRDLIHARPINTEAGEGPSNAAKQSPAHPASAVAAVGRRNGWMQRPSKRSLRAATNPPPTTTGTIAPTAPRNTSSMSNVNTKAEAEARAHDQDDPHFELPRLSFQSKYSVAPPHRQRELRSQNRLKYYQNYRPPTHSAYYGAMREKKTAERAAPSVLQERKDPVFSADQWGSLFKPPTAPEAESSATAASATDTSTAADPPVPTATTPTTPDKNINENKAEDETKCEEAECDAVVEAKKSNSTDESTTPSTESGKDASSQNAASGSNKTDSDTNTNTTSDTTAATSPADGSNTENVEDNPKKSTDVSRTASNKSSTSTSTSTSASASAAAVKESSLESTAEAQDAETDVHARADADADADEQNSKDSPYPLSLAATTSNDDVSVADIALEDEAAASTANESINDAAKSSVRDPSNAPTERTTRPSISSSL